MSTAAATILGHLRTVDSERARRADTPDLSAKVLAIKAYQQRRFCHTYADLLKSPRYGAASRFFLEELYGPTDFTLRDAQFARVVPALVRLFPSEIVETVTVLSALHALSESLDSAMGMHLDGDSVDGLGYIRAWQRTARSEDRSAQLVLTLDVAERLDGLTRRPFLRNSLRLMRGPARAAGLGDLQRFLEAGFDTFREMKGADQFIGIVGERERDLAAALFIAVTDEPGNRATIDAITYLPSRDAESISLRD